ncbi:MAG: DNA gyrase subunit A [Planctomycetota bacterium]|nr:DNA gyrase subunit A [Planctomycetota bacterium]
MADDPNAPPDQESAPTEGNGDSETSGPADIHGGVIQDLLIEDDLKRSYLTYAMSVIVSRALPDARDGLKPSQRRILVAMNDLNLGPRAKFRKCALIVGDCMGKYHPHGDQAIYPTLARLAQDWNTRYLLIQGQGNFGSVNPDPPAAMRYTEARMTGPTVEMLDDLDKDTVDFVKNYDESRDEPTVLPGKFPNLLVNGGQGIAVGMATNMPPHNLTEICDALVHLIENPDCTVDDLMKFVKGPDFPSAGLVCGRRGIEDYMRTGRGYLTLRARHHFEEEKDREKIVITEIPYQVGITRLIEKIVDAAKHERINGIYDVIDNTSKEGIRIVIELKRGENRDVVLNQLFKYTPLEYTFSVNALALVRGRPRVLNLKQLMQQYLEHRKEVIKRRTRWLLARAEEEAHIVEGLLIALDHIDDIIKIIRSSKDTESAREQLMDKYEFSTRQATQILNMPLRTLTGLERDKLKARFGELQEMIRDYQDILTNEMRVLEIMKEDAFELKEKYADGRRTMLVGEAGELGAEDLIADEVMAVTITHKGYIKREPLSSYRVQSRGGKGIIGAKSKDEEDFPEHLFIASTHDYLLFFVSDGRVYWQKVYDLPQLGRMAQGRALVNLLELAAEQKVVSIVPVKNFDEDASIFMVSEKGYLKKCLLSEYKNPRRGGISTMGLEDGDRLMDAKYVKRGQEIVLATKQGMAVRFLEDVVRDMGRSARGVNGPRLEDGDQIVSVVVGAATDFLLTVCEKGVGKRTQMDEYRQVGNQRSKGVINVKITDKNGPVVAVLPVREGDELMVMTASGKVIRSPIEDVRETGRGAVGVKLVDLEGEDKVAAVARVAREDAEAAHEQAAALKAEAKEQAERDGKTKSGKHDPIGNGTNGTGGTNGSGGEPKPEGDAAATPEASADGKPAGEQPEKVQELLKRAEDAEKEAQDAAEEDRKDEPKEGDAESTN